VLYYIYIYIYIYIFIVPIEYTSNEKLNACVCSSFKTKYEDECAFNLSKGCTYILPP